MGHLTEFHPAPGAVRGAFYLADVRQQSELLTPYAGTVRMVYLDLPPFGARPIAQVRVGRAGFSGKGEKKQRVEIPGGGRDREAYLSLVRAALVSARALLTADGSLYLHVNGLSPQVRMAADEIFGEKNLRNEIVWHYHATGRARDRFSARHDTILLYGKTPKPYFNPEAAAMIREGTPRGHLKRTVDEAGRVCYTAKSGGKLYVYHEDDPVYPDDVWEKLELQKQEYVGYEGQKPVSLLQRMILASTRPGDRVADLFAGSGTTAVAATALGRSWLAMDISPMAMNCHRRRLMGSYFALWGPEPEEAELAQVRPLLIDGEITPKKSEETEWIAVGRMTREGAVIQSQRIRTVREPALDRPMLFSAVEGAVVVAADYKGNRYIQKLYGQAEETR